MIELPISKFMKNYYAENGYEFTDFQKATIIWNADSNPWGCSMATRSEIFTMLRELADTTADEELKKQINERLEYEERQEKAFYKTNGDSFYMTTAFYDDDSTAISCFKDLKPAIAYGKAECEKSFKIKKLKLLDAPKDGEEGADTLGVAFYAKDGELLDCYSHECEDVDLDDRSRFEQAYFHVYHPFERGDIVRSEGDCTPMIVESFRESEEKFEQRIKEKQLPVDYTDIAIRTECIYDDGGMCHEHPNPLYLEPVTQWENEDVWKVLQAVSALIKGDGYMDDFWFRYDAIDRICAREKADKCRKGLIK